MVYVDVSCSKLIIFPLFPPCWKDIYQIYLVRTQDDGQFEREIALSSSDFFGGHLIDAEEI